MTVEDGEHGALALLHLEPCAVEDTYLDPDLYSTCWIGPKWDVAQGKHDGFALYRKGNFVIHVGTFDLALAIVADALGVDFGGTDG